MRVGGGWIRADGRLPRRGVGRALARRSPSLRAADARRRASGSLVERRSSASARDIARRSPASTSMPSRASVRRRSSDSSRIRESSEIGSRSSRPSRTLPACSRYRRSSGASTRTSGGSSTASRSSVGWHDLTELPAETDESPRPLEGSQATRLPFRRANDLLRVHADGRHGERPHRRLFPVPGAREVIAPIRYARSGDVNIAYQVTGDGPFDLVLVPGFFSHLEVDWEHPAHAHFLERLGSFARLIRFDKRGTGLSDRDSRASRLRDPDGRRPCGHGRARQRVSGALRLLGGRADVRRCSPPPIRSASGHSSCTGRTRSGRIPTTTILGRRRGRSGASTPRELEETWGEDVDLVERCAPNADAA